MREFKPGRRGNASGEKSSDGDLPEPNFNYELPSLPPGQSDGGDELDEHLSWKLRNDIGNADRFRERFGDSFAYVEEIGWHSWVGTHWDAKRGDRQAQLAAHATALKIYDEAKAAQRAGRREGESGEDFADRIDGLRGFASVSGNSTKLGAMLREAQPYLACAPNEMDVDVMAFNVRNGTLRLGTHKDGDSIVGSVDLTPHNRTDYITKCAPVSYDSEADCPLFQNFLNTIMPSIPLQNFLQRWFGYCLTGDTREQVLVMFHGKGANGKSVLVDTVNYILGSYGKTIQFASLLQDDRKRGSEASPDLAQLPGKRLVSASEPKQGAQFDEGLIKQLTGQDVMNVRHLNRDFFEFKPNFKLVLLFNNKPKVRGQDEGIWRRLILIPFGVMISVEERDKLLGEKLKREASGILNWMLDGYRLWAESGLPIPEEAAAAKQAYREQSDPIGLFLNDAIVDKMRSMVPATRLYGAYVRWCKLNAEAPVGQKLFGNIMSDKGYRRHKSGIQYYEDIDLTDDYQPTATGGYGEGED